MEKILHLTLKKKWFDMIASGEKKEEYRDIKDYWAVRLFEGGDHDKPIPYTHVEYKNGYNKYAPTMLLIYGGVHVDCGNVAWGAEFGKDYYVILNGKIISKNF